MDETCIFILRQPTPVVEKVVATSGGKVVCDGGGGVTKAVIPDKGGRYKMEQTVAFPDGMLPRRRSTQAGPTVPCDQDDATGLTWKQGNTVVSAFLIRLWRAGRASRQRTGTKRLGEQA